jgi:hypothetical protein
MRLGPKLAAVVAAAFAGAAGVGAYLDWIWWPVYSGLMLTLAAIAILAVAGSLTLIARHHGRVRRVGFVTIAIGVGLLAGQNLGPSREPLIHQFGGTMTLRLEAPVVAVATGPADCTNVARATEFSVTGDSNMTLDTADRPFVMVYVNVGDRWKAIDGVPRKDGVRLDLGLEGRLATEAGKPVATQMQATPSSTVVATFGNAGGSIHFANLVARTGPDSTGEQMDLAETLEWTCGEVQP